jgi:hypothetical protein
MIAEEAFTLFVTYSVCTYQRWSMCEAGDLSNPGMCVLVPDMCLMANLQTWRKESLQNGNFPGEWANCKRECKSKCLLFSPFSSTFNWDYCAMWTLFIGRVSRCYFDNNVMCLMSVFPFRYAKREDASEELTTAMEVWFMVVTGSDNCWWINCKDPDLETMHLARFSSWASLFCFGWLDAGWRESWYWEIQQKDSEGMFGATASDACDKSVQR